MTNWEEDIDMETDSTVAIIEGPAPKADSTTGKRGNPTNSSQDHFLTKITNTEMLIQSKQLNQQTLIAQLIQIYKTKGFDPFMEAVKEKSDLLPADFLEQFQESPTKKATEKKKKQPSKEASSNEASLLDLKGDRLLLALSKLPQCSGTDTKLEYFAYNPQFQENQKIFIMIKKMDTSVKSLQQKAFWCILHMGLWMEQIRLGMTYKDFIDECKKELGYSRRTIDNLLSLADSYGAYRARFERFSINIGLASKLQALFKKAIKETKVKEFHLFFEGRIDEISADIEKEIKPIEKIEPTYLFI